MRRPMAALAAALVGGVKESTATTVSSTSADRRVIRAATGRGIVIADSNQAEPCGAPQRVIVDGDAGAVGTL
jgi:hypothetical protein